MSSPRPQRDANVERASRVRDNKRRHRARRKEYVLDLERKLAETHKQGVQATREVQLAAQRVARENARLRDLLSKIGYTDKAIDAWVRKDGSLDGSEQCRVVPDSISEKSAQKGASTCSPQTGRVVGALNVSVNGGESPSMMASTSGDSSPKNRKSELSCTKVYAGTFTETASLSRKTDTTGAPCQLLSLLAENPSADITQVSPSTRSEKQPCKNSTPEDCSSDGVECFTAYKMLMHYATSEEKMESIATALESGCTPSATGGCKVRNSVVWKVLDQE